MNLQVCGAPGRNLLQPPFGELGLTILLACYAYTNTQLSKQNKTKPKKKKKYRNRQHINWQ